MKGQSEIIVFILLFVIGVSLFLSAVVWSQGIFERNSDMAKLNSAESFMKNLDSKIKSIMMFGGQDSINYGLDATIELVGTDTIEIKTPLTVEIPENWIIVSNKTSIIKEKLDGGLFRMQLYYPEDEYAIELYTEGPRIATPRTVHIERGSSYKLGGITYNKIKITFK